MKSRLAWQMPAVKAAQSTISAHNVAASSVLSERQHFIEHRLTECYTRVQRQVMPLHPVSSESRGIKCLA